MDTQILFSHRHDRYVRSLAHLPPVSGRPGLIDVMDIVYYDNGMIDCKGQNIEERKFEAWIMQDPNTQALSSASVHIDRVSRFVLGPALVSAHFGYQSEHFPGLDCYPCDSLPFPVSSYTKLEDAFNLPASTPWMLVTCCTHFQRYDMGFHSPGEQGLGFTMCVSSRGILQMEVCASISYRPSTGTVKAFLQGLSSQQQAEVDSQLRAYSMLASHPLLLPIILVDLKALCIEEEEASIWNLLVNVEGRSRQTGAPEVNKRYSANDHRFSAAISDQSLPMDRGIQEADFHSITRDVVGVIQRATYAESHSKALLLSIDEIRKSLEIVKDSAKQHNLSHIDQIGKLLSGKLDQLEQKARVVMGDIAFVEKRAQAQQAAVYNFVAQRDAKLQQRMAKISSQIARASKRDSSAMKGLAVLTMVFLPGTFMATFFAMPILEYTANSRLPIAKHSFWLYWAVTVPLTVTVLLVYALFVSVVDRRHRKEDRDSQRGGK